MQDAGNFMTKECLYSDKIELKNKLSSGDRFVVDPHTLAVPQKLYNMDTVSCAKFLLGKMLIKHVDEKWAGGYIVETEAYLGENDQASHASRRRTLRNEVMFGPPGYAYVYFIYGMFYCFNVVAYDPVYQKAGAVLIRALEPILDIEGMKQRRKKTKLEEITSGPGKLCQSLDITISDNGASLQQGDLLVTDTGDYPEYEIVTGQRIGISTGIEHPYRFYIKDCPYVSTYRKKK
jgi:DNA-3-methyladenine glycosylase